MSANHKNAWNFVWLIYWFSGRSANTIIKVRGLGVVEVKHPRTINQMDAFTVLRKLLWYAVCAVAYRWLAVSDRHPVYSLSKLPSVLLE